MVELTIETQKRIDFFFSDKERGKVEQLLIERCGNNLPFLDKATSEDLERFQFAALKESGSF